MSPDPIRIHRVIARLNVGGPAMHVVNLARALGERGFRTRLLAGPVGPDEGDMGYYARDRGVEVTPIPHLRRELSPLADLQALRSLYRWFRRERPHVVHTHTAKAGALGRLAARLAGVPVVVHTYHGHVLGGSYFSPAVTGVYRAVERRMARSSQRLVTLTSGLADELATVHGVAPREHFAVVPLGLELERFLELDREAAREEVRRETGAPASALVVGIVGRLVPVKNHELLLDALAQTQARHPRVELWIVGSGEREGELRERVRRLGLQDRVRWLGWRSDLERLYAGMDVMALSSRDEGTPVALLEAAAAGVPIVATRVGGIPEMFHGLPVEPRLVPPGDATAFSQALSRELDEAPRSFPKAHRQAVVARFSVERLAEDLAALYRELLAGTGSLSPGAVGSSRP